MGLIQPTRRQLTAPVNVSALLKAIGPTKAAAKLGVSPTLLHKGRRDGEISQVVELAAARVLEEVAPAPLVPAQETTPLLAQRAEEALILLSVAQDKVPLVIQIAKALHAEYLAA